MFQIDQTLTFDLENCHNREVRIISSVLKTADPDRKENWNYHNTVLGVFFGRQTTKFMPSKVISLKYASKLQLLCDCVLVLRQPRYEPTISITRKIKAFRCNTTHNNRRRKAPTPILVQSSFGVFDFARFAQNANTNTSCAKSVSAAIIHA